ILQWQIAASSAQAQAVTIGITVGCRGSLAQLKYGPDAKPCRYDGRRPGAEIQALHTIAGSCLWCYASNAEITADQIRLGVELLGGSAPDHLPLFDHVVLVDEMAHFLEVFVDEQDSLALLFQFIKACPDFLTDNRGQTFRGVIEDEQTRVCQQRTANGQHLLLAA